ncbi:MAG: error-prone DNA polymerase [Rhodoferax sp.]|nr:error-prone DNA polymerase [Rhodoferax sp.]
MEPAALTLEYAELHCLTNFSFQRGASHAEELVARAHALGYTALAITDECSVAGVVRAHVAAKKWGLKLLSGAEFAVQEGFKFVALAHDLTGWGNLCEFISAVRGRAAKGTNCVSWHDGDLASLQGCEILLVLPSAIKIEAACAIATRAKALFGTYIWLVVELQLGLDDDVVLHRLQKVSTLTGVPLVAAGNVHMHVRSRKPLQDVITAVRLGKSVAECGFELQANAEAHLRSRERLAAIYPPDLLANTLTVAARCTFNLDELRYQYPVETVLPGMSPAQTLRHFTYEGALGRYPDGMPGEVRQQVEHELALIAELKYEMYFLTVHDIVRFARSIHILCQGRGSAANSAVCYCLGITEVNPLDGNLLFARFISRERNEPPDIDVDFEHDRREEVIQYIYEKYGRDRAAIAATVVTYRPRSAIRDVGKALGVDDALIDRLAKEHFWFDGEDAMADHLVRVGLDLDDAHIHQWLAFTKQLLGFPRHLSQHVGGFVLTQGKLTRLVPVENAAMVDRSIIQWDKDDLDAMGLLKVDVLALGMLSAIRRCLDLVGQCGGPKRMQDVPREDEATYDMICAADTVGVFQIESRAQMSMLPRLKPRKFYDLVVEVAIVRPGPIQGGMVHPYLKARQDPDNVKYPSQALKEALSRTLGIPIFQEQVMQIAILAADFSPGEADELRRSMAAWKRSGGVHKFHDRLVNQMVKNGYEEAFSEAIFKQMLGFGEYGFPESHAASFAQLAYVSSWLKCHHPACFLTALLNSQPMGFYPPAQLVYDAKRHGVEVLSVDVMVSGWDCTLEGQAVRLGLCLVSGLNKPAAGRIVTARSEALFTSTEDLALRAALNPDELKALAAADALTALSGHRRQQVWDAAALQTAPHLLESVPIDEVPLLLNAASEGEEVVFDYASVGLTLRRHPLQILREQLSKMKLLTAVQMRDLPHGRLVRACGIVTARQQPPTAKGVVFITLEDETGTMNVIVWRRQREKQREQVLKSRLLAVYGVWQRNTEDAAIPAEKHQGEVRHLIAHHLIDLTHLLGELATQSREFH